MKKIILFIAVFCSLLFVSSCAKDETRYNIGSNTKESIKVRLGNQDTKSTGSNQLNTLFAVPFTMENGDTLYLVATIEDMPDYSPQTKGTPASTDNIGTVYQKFYTSVYKGSTTYVSDVSGKPMGKITAEYNKSNNNWRLTDPENNPEGEDYFWPLNGGILNFCSYAPIEAFSSTNNYVSNLVWAPEADEVLSFSYSNPALSDGNDGYHDAESQKDLLFAFDPHSKESNTKNGKGYADINFSHALTAVKFIRGNIADCTIERISLSNFYSDGTATAKATTIDGANGLEFTWTTGSVSKTFKQDFNRLLNEDVQHQDPEASEITGGSLDSSPAESYTFMVIPQKMDNGQKMVINIKERIHPIEFDLSSVEKESLLDWSSYAGKLITFSVNSNFDGELVHIMMDDNCEENVKKDVTVANKGSQPVYVRAAIVANWVKEDGTIIYPCRVEESELEGYNTSNWAFVDGFFYYKYQVPVETQITFFTKYTAPLPGDPEYPSIPDVDHLEMIVLFQAVDAEDDKEGKTGKQIIAEYGWPTDVFVD